jgi:hypothetical protein
MYRQSRRSRIRSGTSTGSNVLVPGTMWCLLSGRSLIKDQNGARGTGTWN